MIQAFVQERESGKYLAAFNESGATFVSDRQYAKGYPERIDAEAAAAVLPFVCDVVVLSRGDA